MYPLQAGQIVADMEDRCNRWDHNSSCLRLLDYFLEAFDSLGRLGWGNSLFIVFDAIENVVRR